MAAAMTIGLLIVGDADRALALGEQFACAAGIAVEEAEAAQEALARIENGSPDVVLIADDIENLVRPDCREWRSSCRSSTAW